MMNRSLNLFRLLLVLMVLVLDFPVLSAQENARFSLYRKWDLSLTPGQCREMVSVGLAVLEKESPKLCDYIDMEAAPQITGNTFEIDDESKKNMKPGNFYYGMDSGTLYYCILFTPKEEHAYRFEEGYAAVVYLRADHTPFGLKMGYRTNSRHERLRYDKPLVRKDDRPMPKVMEVPAGFPEMADEVRERLTRKSVDVVKAQVEGHYSILNHDFVPIVMRVLVSREGEEPRQAYRTVLATRGAFVYVSMWEDNGEVFDIYFDFHRGMF